MLSNIHGSLNVFARRLSKTVVPSLQTEPSVLSNDASSKPLGPPSCDVPKVKDGASIFPLPVPGTFVNLYEREVPSKDALNHNSTRSRRISTEMPLSSHPPFKESWIEIEPFQTHISRPRVHLGAEIKDRGSNAPNLEDAVVRKESTEAMPSRPYHGIILPPLPPIPHAHQRRREPHSKPSLPISRNTTPTTLLKQSIAPLTPRHPKNTTNRPVQSPCSSGASSAQERYNVAGKNSWGNGRSPVGNSLQLEIFSELDVELNEAMNLYTASEMSWVEYRARSTERR